MPKVIRSDSLRPHGSNIEAYQKAHSEWVIRSDSLRPHGSAEATRYLRATLGDPERFAPASLKLRGRGGTVLQLVVIRSDSLRPHGSRFDQVTLTDEVVGSGAIRSGLIEASSVNDNITYTKPVIRSDSLRPHGSTDN